MRTLTTIALCATLTACMNLLDEEMDAATKAKLVQQEEKAQAKVFACANNQVAQVDDLMSDASTIAFALSLACNKEHRETIEAMSYRLQGQDGKQSWRELMDTRESRIKVFLPIVLTHRQRARTER